MTHTGYISESFTGDTYSAGCSCDWVSPEYNTREEAESALSLHYKETKE